ncbi:MAG: hypothetical protein WDO18_07180 [Acidobacteriota bacterium]
MVPLYKTNRDEIVTQYDMVGLEKLGLLKMDFLGLTTPHDHQRCSRADRKTSGRDAAHRRRPHGR